MLKVFYGGIFIKKEILLREGINHPIKLEYYKMINEEKDIYGIYIVKTEYKEKEIITEEKEIKYLSSDEAKINKILDLFKEHIVTPITAQEIVEDLLKQTF